jgi:hypothetical protein
MKLEYICRQDLLEEIDEIIGYINFTSPYQDDNDLIVSGLERARDVIECAATVDVRADIRARSHGRWIICSDGYYPYCSECKHEPKSGNMTHYCPNCQKG